MMHMQSTAEEVGPLCVHCVRDPAAVYLTEIVVSCSDFWTFLPEYLVVATSEGIASLTMFPASASATVAPAV
jgi:hypothetical protein